MKISLNWLSDYIEVKDFYKKPEELGRILTRAGLELEGIVNQSEQFKNIVVGKIEKLEKHSNADKLTVCQVDVGADELHQIVCGAKNHKAGDWVVAALPGAVLPGDFAIKKSKIRGEVSLGMLCSQKELGLSDESQGIMILESKGLKPGKPIAKLFKLNDVIFEISVTPNRADCLSHIGLARELSCLLDRKLTLAKPKLTFGKDKVKDTVKVSLKRPKECPRYAGRLIRGVKVAESPAWLKSRIESMDMNSINNIVDATNYVMMEWGQPIHAFDLKELQGGEIRIDLSNKKEKFTTLDGTELTLTGEELMIRDGDRPVALAGIVGGLNSGVSDSTTDVFIETAYFTQKIVRQSSRRFGIETDSCYRFSRGTDPENVPTAMDRVCELIQMVAGGECSKDHWDAYPSPVKHKPIKIKLDFVESKLGYKVKSAEFSRWMKRLGCKVDKKEDTFKVMPPAWRWDLIQDVDLVEEYGRLHGYENIDEILPPLIERPTEHDDQYLKERQLEKILLAEGLMQSMNYHFINGNEQLEVLGNSSVYEAFQLSVTDQPVAVKNPLNEDVNCMRTSLIPGLVRNLTQNYRHGNEWGRLFEIGSVFNPKGSAKVKSDRVNSSGAAELFHLAFCFWGQPVDYWSQGEKVPVVYQLRQSVTNMLEALKINQWSWLELKSDEVPKYLHPSQSIALQVEGKTIGVFGSLHPELVSKNKIRTSVAMGEFNFEKLMARQPRYRKFKSLSRLQRVDRDLAFVIPETVSSQQVEKVIRKHAGPLLSNIIITDVYQGDKLEKGHRSVAYRMTFKPSEKTLEENELQALQDKIITGAKSDLGIQIRH
ncbi:MAG: phenylalanine--tRNA ligase subunit beta [Bdellovibrionaceae bacterium]|nr:phenylalanine--tRNA ligase subunit beta [Pseudobdellovibrionaceae bacterium]|tara:strand:- start:32895 stop:35369 length:2475 start_codon:yes stop_codon:yes gene_type:complete